MSKQPRKGRQARSTVRQADRRTAQTAESQRANQKVNDTPAVAAPPIQEEGEVDSDALGVVADIKERLEETRNSKTLFDDKDIKSTRSSYQMVKWTLPFMAISGTVFYMFSLSASEATPESIAYFQWLSRSAITGATFGFFAKRVLGILLEEAPKQYPDADIWRWKQGRKYFINMAIAIVLLGLGMAIMFPSATDWFLLAATSYSSYLLLILFVAWQPQLFRSIWIQALSNALYGLFSAFASVAFVSIFPSVAQSIHSDGGYFLALILTITSVLVVSRTFRKGLSPLQNEVLHVVVPEKLLYVLRSFETEIQERLEALTAFKKLEQQYPYGVRKELVNILMKKYGTPRSSLVLSTISIVLISLFMLAYTSFGQFLLFDLVYEPYIKPLLCNANLMSCPKP